MGSAYTYHHASVLVAQAPQGSRVLRRADEGSAWNDATRLLHRIEHSARVLAWQRTKDGAKGRNKPKPLPEPGDVVPSREETEQSARDVAEALGIEV